MLSIITYVTAVINKVMKNMMMFKFFRREQLINITKSLVLLLSFWEIQKERSLEKNERKSEVLVTNLKTKKFSMNLCSDIELKRWLR
jgi:hypothetical protein